MKSLALGFILSISFNLYAKSDLGRILLKDNYAPAIKPGFTTKIGIFSTDGCSAFPDGIIPNKTTEWLHCCIKHDIDYWIGGRKELKKISDKNLRSCVSDSVGSLIGMSMDLGVTIGGVPSLLPWRWAYGWDYPIAYDELTKVQLISAAAKYDTVIDSIREQKELLTPLQILSIDIKLRSKLMELYPFLGNNAKEKSSEYKRLIDRINEELR